MAKKSVPAASRQLVHDAERDKRKEAVNDAQTKLSECVALADLLAFGGNDERLSEHTLETVCLMLMEHMNAASEALEAPEVWA